MANPTKVQMSLRAVLGRINRRLRQAGEHLYTNRADREQSTLGHYYIVNLRENRIARTHVDVEALAREMGLLKPWEEIMQEKTGT
jgi:hypothetical protein